VDNIILFVAIYITLLALDLFAVASRAAYQQTSHARLLSYKDRTGAQVGRAIDVLLALPRLTASMSLMLVFTRIFLAGFSLYLLFQQFERDRIGWLFIALFVIALALFWLEWFVERSVKTNAERWALRLAGFARFGMFVFALPLGPLPISANLQTGSDSSLAEVTEDEVKTLVDAGQETGVFEQDERRMIYSIFELGDTVAREIMVPRIDMQALDVNTSLSDAIDALLTSGHSRVPVYDGTVDNTIGLLYAKELLRAGREENAPTSLRALLRPAYFVPETKKLDELLAEMQSQRIHLAIAIDEYGGVAGLVTLEDIAEEILGEIKDEYDVEEDLYQKQPEGGFLFSGMIPLDDFNDIMGANISDDDADTLGGYIYRQSGHVPGMGEEIRTGDLLLTVAQVAGRRIKKVSARWLPEKESDHEGQTFVG